MLRIVISVALVLALTPNLEAAGKRRLAQAPRLPQAPPVRLANNCGDPNCPCGCATGAPCTCLKAVKAFTNTSLVCENGTCSAPPVTSVVSTPSLSSTIDCSSGTCRVVSSPASYGNPIVLSNGPSVTYSVPSYSYASTPVYYAPNVSYGVYGGYRSYGSYGGGFSGGCSGGSCR